MASATNRSVLRHGRPDRCRGTALIEMIAILPLMIAFILFTLFACRWLVFQGRILAASRTAAWLVAHADDTEGKLAGTVSGAAFAERLRDWHFAPNPGVVVVQAPVITDGLFASGRASQLMDAMNQLTDKQMSKSGGAGASQSRNSKRDSANDDYEADVAAFQKEEADQQDTDDEAFVKQEEQENKMGVLLAKFLTGVVDYLSSDFKRCEVRVDYWMPLPFRLSAFERLLGRQVHRGGGQAPAGSAAAFQAMGQAGTEYALLSLGSHTTCVIPVLDPGREGGVGEALGEAITQIEGLLEKVEKALKGSRDSELYRPMEHGLPPGAAPAADAVDAVMQPEFYALLVYEYLDPLHKQAKPYEGMPSPGEGLGGLLDFF